uniref:Uncharacterized protein n=1 Tax=Arundo donax TaxID=35708 RepID=A0A0A8XR38_ARUDO
MHQKQYKNIFGIITMTRSLQSFYTCQKNNQLVFLIFKCALLIQRNTYQATAHLLDKGHFKIITI